MDNGGERIEDLYDEYRAQGEGGVLGMEVGQQRIASSFERTVEHTEALRGSGSFHPHGTRTPLRDLFERPPKDQDEPFPTTHDFAASLWQPRYWDVADHPELAFYYVDREIQTGRVEKSGSPVQAEIVVSADLLLVNANLDDRTPILAEVKLGGDRNAELALIQVLAAAAQLSPERQRRRLPKACPRP